MDQPLPAIGRATFTIHTIVAVAVGLPLLAAPLWFGSLFGWASQPELQPVLRAFGAMFLGLGALTSFLAARASSWAQAEFIVRGEMVYLALQSLVFALGALTGVGPALGNWAFFACSAVLLVLFAATFAARPRAAKQA
ncbi:MAG TPA: hypothetical protein VFM53_11560 [Anaeromyxobacteraceae bacterium]|nr:hypothetical protein [Anaeromyxobacteraceae bacterium]